MTDLDLARRAAQGDPEAFGALVEHWAPAVRRVTRAALGDPDEADDAAQDAFLSAWANIRSYDPSRPFGPWILRIASNRALDRGRRRKVRAADPLPEDRASAGPLPDQVTESAILRERLDAALAQLPPRQRVAVTMFDAEGYSHGEIAEVLGIPEGTVRSDVFHARRALRVALASYRGGEG
ncbi:MAG TPA: sigma-70 family RNA polymerase sigma factor [Gemmatimonadales bacterium]|nr:sigma-70 family RNA polymerase sigma factor [Gemmatimonadales bacterium]